MEEMGAEQAKSLGERAFRLRMMGSLREARGLYLRSLEIWRGLGEQRAIAESLQKLGEIAMDLQWGEEAESSLRESAALWQALGEWNNCSECLWKLGRMARGQGRYADAEDLQQRRGRYREWSRQQWEESMRRRGTGEG
ncbi:MAG: tetratricopeptide repeat protein [Chloroflexi bacterium]|nr:tetratricopeptide repeat protein [Chloroflexota bacterium]MBI4197610.1 tetratricopeptide repeat protein [Chloroflexota bacterium]